MIQKAQPNSQLHQPIDCRSIYTLNVGHAVDKAIETVKTDQKEVFEFNTLVCQLVLVCLLMSFFNVSRVGFFGTCLFM